MVTASPVIVTGVTSFVGMHLAKHFAAQGRKVVAVTQGSIDQYDGIRARRLKFLAGHVKFAQADVTDARSVDALIERSAPSLWLHHAGFADSYGSLDYDIATGLRVNVISLLHVYRALAGSSCGVIVTGSSAEYASSAEANNEDDVCWPDTPYGLVKLAETLRARQLAEQYAIPTRVARLYIPFGALDNPEKLLAQVVDGLRNKTPVSLSACTQQRDFLGVFDLCAAYLALENDLPRTQFDIFNVCSGRATELRAFLLDIAGRMKATSDLLEFGKRSMRLGETAISFGSNEKAARLLGWRPSDLDHAIDRDLLHASDFAVAEVAR